MGVQESSERVGLMQRSLLPLLILSLSACGRAGAPGATAETASRVIERDLPEEGLVVQEVDLDGNGRPDIWNYYRERASGPRLRVRKKVDLDLDGRVDVVSTFDERGDLEREEMDADFDGIVDWIDHFKDGVRVLSEADTNFDGRSDVFSYYAIGTDGRPHIDRKERDTNGDGLIDLWERFDTEGNVIRTGRDTDGDGKMDERDE